MSLGNIDGKVTTADLFDLGLIGRDANGRMTANGGAIPVVNVKQSPYNATGDGVADDTAAIAAAVAALPSGGILYFPVGNYVNNTLRALAGNTTVRGAGPASIITGKGFQLVTGCVLEDMHFEASGNMSVQIKGGTPQSNIKIRRCRFVTGSPCISIELPTNAQPQEDISISYCEFDSCATAISVAAGQFCDFSHNTFGEYSTNTQNILFYGGNRNRIIGNRINGGTTGIAFVYHKTNSGGATGVCWGNTIQGNVCQAVLEESITLDDRGNQADMAPMEIDTVASHATNTITLTSANWAAAGAPFLSYYAIFTTGTLRGCFFKITAQSNAVLTLAIESNAYGQISNGDEVVIGAPFFANTITGNVVDANGGTDGTGSAIMLWGLCYANTVVGNACYGKGIWVASHHGLTPNTPVTNVVRKAPSENNTISGNVIIGSPTHYANDSQLNLHYINYGGGVDYTSVGNVVIANQLVNAVLTVTRHKAVLLQPQGSYADVYANLAAGDNAGWVAK